MKIKFINHASLLIQSKFSILCDPWYCGTAFADGWRLLYDNEVDINSLSYDKIWISHEHPDHFSIATLKQIKGNKEFLYQKTNDKKVINYLQNRGHSVKEMPDNKTLFIDDLKLTTIVTEGYDSCLLVEDENTKFLNINDAQLDRLEELEKIRSHIPVDVIAIQFHYANWAGNKGDKTIPEFKRRNAVARIKKISDFCGTKKIILFASYIYYCHEENFYWNQFDSIGRTVNELEEIGLNVVIPKPDTEIDFSRELDMDDIRSKNKINICFWENLLASKCPVEITKTIEINSILNSYKKFISKLNQKNRLDLYRNTDLNDFNLIIKLTDLDTTIKLWLFHERAEETNEKKTDISMSSDALLKALSTDYGLGSVTISSRINFNYKFAYKLYFFFLIAYRNNIGVYLKSSITDDLNFESFRNNGVLKPIFTSDKEAKELFDKFIKKINRVDKNLL